jgi:hypothetical protein
VCCAQNPAGGVQLPALASSLGQLSAYELQVGYCCIAVTYTYCHGCILAAGRSARRDHLW